MCGWREIAEIVVWIDHVVHDGICNIVQGSIQEAFLSVLRHRHYEMESFERVELPDSRAGVVCREPSESLAWPFSILEDDNIDDCNDEVPRSLEIFWIQWRRVMWDWARVQPSSGLLVESWCFVATCPRDVNDMQLSDTCIPQDVEDCFCLSIVSERVLRREPVSNDANRDVFHGQF